MIADLEYDFSRMNDFVSGLNGALMGSSGDGNKLLKTEAGQLAWEISESIGPSNLAKATKRISWEMKRHLSTVPAYSTFEDAERQGYSSHSDFTWLTGGPRWLLGINDEDNQVKASGDEALKLLRVSQKSQDRGNAYVSLGTRRGKGTQKLLRLNRIRISKSAFLNVRKNILSRVGQARASFARTASILIPKKRIPPWVQAQFAAVESNGKTIFDDSKLNHPTEPSIAFGSRAKGVTSNPAMVNIIKNAINHRSYILFDKMKKILSGYKYDWETGRVFKPKDEIIASE